jgi:hypothetical protein
VLDYKDLVEFGIRTVSKFTYASSVSTQSHSPPAAALPARVRRTTIAATMPTSTITPTAPMTTFCHFLNLDLQTFAQKLLRKGLSQGPRPERQARFRTRVCARVRQPGSPGPQP